MQDTHTCACACAYLWVDKVVGTKQCAQRRTPKRTPSTTSHPPQPASFRVKGLEYRLTGENMQGSLMHMQQHLCTHLTQHSNPHTALQPSHSTPPLMQHSTPHIALHPSCNTPSLTQHSTPHTALHPSHSTPPLTQHLPSPAYLRGTVTIMIAFSWTCQPNMNDPNPHNTRHCRKDWGPLLDHHSLTRAGCTGEGWGRKVGGGRLGEEGWRRKVGGQH